MATVTKSIGTTGRDYSTITLWEADLDDDTPYDAADDAVGECYNDSAFDEQVTINGGGTLGLTSIALTVATGERHDGTEGSGARIVLTSKGGNNTVASSVALDTEISWLEVDDAAQTADSTAIVKVETSATGKTHTIKNNILHGGASSNSGLSHALSFNVNNAATFNALNNIVYDCDNSLRVFQGIDQTYSRTTNILNNTVHDLTGDHATTQIHGIGHNDHSATIVQNNVVTGIVNAGAGGAQCYEHDAPASATMSHNLASDTSASGTGSLDSKTAANQFVSIVGGSEDLHLKTGADAIDAGTDPGTTPSGVEIDIDGRDRDAEGDTWDMGAHEFVAAATGGFPTRPLLSTGVGA